MGGQRLPHTTTGPDMSLLNPKKNKKKEKNVSDGIRGPPRESAKRFREQVAFQAGLERGRDPSLCGFLQGK